MHFSARIISATLLILTSPLLKSPIWANAARYIEVPLRIEGPSTTIFEGTIRTSGHIVTTALGGTHLCDYVSNGPDEPSEGATPSGTIITAIDNAVPTWDGSWNKTGQDYFITSIAGYTQTQQHFWGLLVDYKLIDTGGCAHKLVTDQDVLVAFDAFGVSAFLKMSPAYQKITPGTPATFTVVDGSEDPESPVEHAQVLGGDTDSDGKVTIKFERVGVYNFKARKDGTIRSNQVIVEVEEGVVEGGGFRCPNG